MTDTPEICICAAVKSKDGRIMRGQRHHDCIRAMREVEWPVSSLAEYQGFITSRNRFVSRQDGLRLQKLAEIPSVRGEGGYDSVDLFSEDLY